MYRCFKRWPGVRNLYGEPCLADLSPPPLLIRAQSPSSVNQTSLSSDGAAPAVEPGSRILTKAAHYQERPEQREVIPVILTPAEAPPAAAPTTKKIVPPLPSSDADDADGGAGTEPPIEKPAPSEQSRDGGQVPTDREPKDAAHGAPHPGEPSNGSSKPTLLPPGQQAPTLPDDALPFSPEAPVLKPTPLSPLPATPDDQEPPPDLDGPPQAPIRNPVLAPPAPQPNPFNAPQPIQPWQTNPRLPLMAYTRVFDGADADLVAALRDYVELNGDLRSGGWEGYLHRSDDFIRFTSYRMILEMLSLHGGEGKHRLIFKLLRYR
jgi:hypothetical protein